LVKPFQIQINGSKEWVRAHTIIKSLGNFDNLEFDPTLPYCRTRDAASLSQAFTATDASVSANVEEIIRPPTHDLDIWVDASTSWGIGLLIGGQWEAWRINEGVLRVDSGRNIVWLEALAVEFVIGVLVSRGLFAMDVLIRCDNQCVIGSFSKGWSRSRLVNDSICRTSLLLRSSNISISFLYVESSSNLADPISRGILPSSNSRITPPFSIHSDVSSFFTRA
jgi:hypothetical protein